MKNCSKDTGLIYLCVGDEKIIDVIALNFPEEEINYSSEAEEIELVISFRELLNPGVKHAFAVGPRDVIESLQRKELSLTGELFFEQFKIIAHQPVGF